VKKRIKNENRDAHKKGSTIGKICGLWKRMNEGVTDGHSGESTERKHMNTRAVSITIHQFNAKVALQRPSYIFTVAHREIVS